MHFTIRLKKTVNYAAIFETVDNIINNIVFVGAWDRKETSHLMSLIKEN